MEVICGMELGLGVYDGVRFYYVGWMGAYIPDLRVFLFNDCIDIFMIYHNFILISNCDLLLSPLFPLDSRLSTDLRSVVA